MDKSRTPSRNNSVNSVLIEAINLCIHYDKCEPARLSGSGVRNGLSQECALLFLVMIFFAWQQLVRGGGGLEGAG